MKLSIVLHIQLIRITWTGKSDVDSELRRLVLSYMNGIQAVYLLPSLYQKIDISIVRMELWTFDPYNNYQVGATTLSDHIVSVTLSDHIDSV